MAQIYSKKTWNNERILDSNMNRMENALAGRAARFVVNPQGDSGDYDTIQNAIDAAEADGGGVVFVKRGDGTVYALATSLVIDESDVHLVSDGAILQPQGVFPAVKVGPGAGTKSNVRVAGFNIDQDYQSHGIEVFRMEDVLIERNRFNFSAFNAAMHCISFSTALSIRAQVLNNIIEVGTGAGIALNFADYAVVMGNIIYDAKGTGIRSQCDYGAIKNNIIKDASSQANNTYWGIYLSGANRNVIGNNVVTSQNANKQAVGINESVGDWNNIHDNIIEHWVGSAVVITGGNSVDSNNLKDGP